MSQDIEARATATGSPGQHPNVRPRDAATVILLDRSGPLPRVLLGRRHSGHVFMPGQLVFPGGRVDPTDHRVTIGTPLGEATERRLIANTRSTARARALAVAAVRELYEETGLCLGSFAATPPDRHLEFSQIGLKPDLGALRLIARAVTPPRRVRRYDTWFFAAEASAVRHTLRDVVGTDTELVELVWLPLAEARAAEVPSITRIVLADLEDQLGRGFGDEIPIPHYYFSRQKRQRDLF